MAVAAGVYHEATKKVHNHNLICIRVESPWPWKLKKISVMDLSPLSPLLCEGGAGAPPPCRLGLIRLPARIEVEVVIDLLLGTPPRRKQVLALWPCCPQREHCLRAPVPSCSGSPPSLSLAAPGSTITRRMTQERAVSSIMAGLPTKATETWATPPIPTLALTAGTTPASASWTCAVPSSSYS